MSNNVFTDMISGKTAILIGKYSFQWNSEIVEQMQQCYENISLSGGNDIFVRNLFRRLDVILNNSENVPVSLLNAATCLCKIVLQKSKPSRKFC